MYYLSLFLQMRPGLNEMVSVNLPDPCSLRSSISNEELATKSRNSSNAKHQSTNKKRAPELLLKAFKENMNNKAGAEFNPHKNHFFGAGINTTG
jgi:hypothetical protein